MNDEVPTPKGRLTRQRVLIAAALLFLTFVCYRVFAVYTVRTGECATFDSTRPPLDWTGTRQEGAAILKFPPRPPTGATRPLLVLTFNIEGHAALWSNDHLERIVAVIRELRPDVVGLQEVHRGTWQSRFKDQVGDLARLTGMNVQFGRSFEAMGGEFGNVVLTRGKILNSDILNLPSTGEPRTLLRTTIDLDGHRFNFYVTHLAAWGKLQRVSRNQQIGCIEEHLRRSDLPFVLVGDFNAGPETPEIGKLTNGSLLRLCGSDLGATHRMTGNRIDHVFADHGWEVRNISVKTIGPSDHWPVIAELGWEPPAGEARP